MRLLGKMKSRNVILERKQDDYSGEVPIKKQFAQSRRFINLSRGFDPFATTLPWYQHWEHGECLFSDGIFEQEQALQLLAPQQMHSMLTSVEGNSPLPLAVQPTAPIDLRTDLQIAMPVVDPAARENQLQQELLLLQQQHQLQKQLLFAEFQKQHETLTRQHQVQLQEHLKQQQELLAIQHQQELLEQERKLEKQRQQQELGRQLREQHLLFLRNKERGRESAVASTEVKQKLQEFLLSKSARDLPLGGQSHALPQHPKLWYMGAHHLSLDQTSPQTGTSPSYKQPSRGIQNTKDDFPLRKAASEPNLKVRSRLKQKVAERRSSPLLRRKDGTLISTFKKRTLERTDSSLCSSAPGSGPSSPNNNCSGMSVENGLSNSPAEQLQPHHRILKWDGAVNAINLYTSPSLPNITLGLPATVVSSASSQINVSTANQNSDRRTIQGTALTGQFRRSIPLSAFLPPAPFDRKVCNTHQALLQHVFLMDQAQNPSPLTTGVAPLHAHSALIAVGEKLSPTLRAANKLPRHRPLNRTHSAPLPQNTQALAQLVVQQQHRQFLEKRKQCHQQSIRDPEETEEEHCQQQVIEEDEEPTCGGSSNSDATYERATALTVQVKKEPSENSDNIQMQQNNPVEKRTFFHQVDSDTVWNEMHSSTAARMVVGCVIELASKVASGELKNGFAVVRPPGHHAEESTAMMFTMVTVHSKPFIMTPRCFIFPSSIMMKETSSLVVEPQTKVQGQQLRDLEINALHCRMV
ncbi:histone deacetylase 9-like isoform X4 [Narcine bancroftii]|uniref:histone deacetylase 9-like isoform X4 n=1 Tax=Narcine bancroftii TaxID=1343680 RepID=UPI003831ECA7